jgi:hypothetical protein
LKYNKRLIARSAAGVAANIFWHARKRIEEQHFTILAFTGDRRKGISMPVS